MSRCPKLEAILEAKYRFENVAPEEHGGGTGTGTTVRQLEDSLRDVYREFIRVKRREGREKLSRIR